MPGSMEIAGIIAGRIVSGEYPRGSKLPSTREFAVEFGVNKNTIWQAMEELKRRGLIIGGRGKRRTVA